jgi:hypothetical protein
MTKQKRNLTRWEMVNCIERESLLPSMLPRTHTLLLPFPQVIGQDVEMLFEVLEEDHVIDLLLTAKIYTFLLAPVFLVLRPIELRLTMT